MARLELPGGGIFEEKWDRAVVDTLAQRDLLVPEASAVAPTCYVKEDGLTYVWNGSAWGIG